MNKVGAGPILPPRIEVPRAQVEPRAAPPQVARALVRDGFDAPPPAERAVPRPQVPAAPPKTT